MLKAPMILKASDGYKLLRTGKSYVPFIQLITASAAITDFRLLDVSLADKTNKVNNAQMSEVITVGWGTTAGWSVTAGKLAHASGGGVTAIDQDVSVTANYLYYVSFDLAWTSGSLSAVSIGGTALSGTYTSAGTFTEIVKATNTNALSFTPTNDFEGSLDNVIVYELGAITTPVYRAKYSDTAGNILQIEPFDCLEFQNGVLGYMAGSGAEADIYLA